MYKSLTIIALILTLLVSTTQAQLSNSRNASGMDFGIGNYAVPQQNKILKCYPNPATTNITFEFQRNYNNGYTLEIYNLPGKRVSLASNMSNTTPITLQNYYRGVYIYKLIDRNGKVVESGKFQVSK